MNSLIDGADELRIRRATIDDAYAISKVHVNSWKMTYKGLISGSYISQLSIEKRKKNWEWTFHHPNRDEVTFVAITNDGETVGFSNGGHNRNEEYEHDGELYAIYLLEQYQGQGIGKSLFHSIVESLSNKGYKSMMVWVLEGNRANGFYRAMGGELIGEKEIVIGSEKKYRVGLLLGKNMMDLYTFVRFVFVRFVV